MKPMPCWLILSTLAGTCAMGGVRADQPADAEKQLRQALRKQYPEGKIVTLTSCDRDGERILQAKVTEKDEVSAGALVPSRKMKWKTVLEETTLIHTVTATSEGSVLGVKEGTVAWITPDAPGAKAINSEIQFTHEDPGPAAPKATRKAPSSKGSKALQEKLRKALFCRFDNVSFKDAREHVAAVEQVTIQVSKAAHAAKADYVDKSDHDSKSALDERVVSFQTLEGGTTDKTVLDFLSKAGNGPLPTLRDALDALTRAVGLSWKQEGDVILITTRSKADKGK